MTIWQVQLEGDVRDLEFLANVLPTGARKVLREERVPGYVYESDSFHPCSTSEEVEQLAEGEVAVLSGILKLEREARDALKYGAIYHTDQTQTVGVTFLFAFASLSKFGSRWGP